MDDPVEALYGKREKTLYDRLNFLPRQLNLWFFINGSVKQTAQPDGILW